MPRLSEAIEDKEALTYDNFVIAKINWRKCGRQKDWNRVTMTVVTDNTAEIAEIARYNIQMTNQEKEWGGGVQNFQSHTLLYNS